MNNTRYTPTRNANNRYSIEVESGMNIRKSRVDSMDQITIKAKASNPKCLLYWCFTEFIDWRYSMYVGIFNPSCELAPL